jgi:hypothetical protein
MVSRYPEIQKVFEEGHPLDEGFRHPELSRDLKSIHKIKPIASLVMKLSGNSQ